MVHALSIQSPCRLPTVCWTLCNRWEHSEKGERQSHPSKGWGQAMWLSESCLISIKWGNESEWSHSCDPMDCSLPGSSVHGIFNSTGVDCHFLLQGIFPTQGSNLGLPHCRQLLYHLSHQRSPRWGKGEINHMPLGISFTYPSESISPIGVVSQRLWHTKVSCLQPQFQCLSPCTVLTWMLFTLNLGIFYGLFLRFHR